MIALNMEFTRCLYVFWDFLAIMIMLISCTCIIYSTQFNCMLCVLSENMKTKFVVSHICRVMEKLRIVIVS